MDVRRRRGNDDFVELLFASGLEQQRDLEHEGRRVRVSRGERLPRLAYRRMDELFQGGELLAICEDDMGEAVAIERAAAHCTREQLTNFGHQSAARTLELAHDGIGIENRHSGCREHLRHGRLPRANGAGKCNADHARSSPRSRSAPSNGTNGIPRMVK